MAQPQFDPMTGTTKPYAIDPVDLARKASLNTKKDLATTQVPSSSIQTTPTALSYDFEKLADTLIQQQQVGTLDRSSAIENLRTFATDNPDVASKMYTAPKFDYFSIQDNLAKSGKDK